MRIASHASPVNQSSISSSMFVRAPASPPPATLTDLRKRTELALESARERLEAGEKLLTEYNRKPGTLNETRFARELGLPGVWAFKTFREQVAELVADFGMSKPALERYSFEDFRAAALDHRARELAAAGALVNDREVALRDLDAALDLAAAWQPAESARRTLSIAALEAPARAPHAIADLAWARSLFQGWVDNIDLPDDPVALMKLGLGRTGTRVKEAAIKSGLTTRTMYALLDGSRRALTTQYRKLEALEKLTGLPKGVVADAYRRLPAEPDPAPEAIYDAEYRLHDWPEAAESEWADYVKLRTSHVVPRNMNRLPTLLSPASLRMDRTMLAAFYGFLTTPLNPEFRIDPMDVGMGFLLFPELIRTNFEFVALRTRKAPSHWIVDWIRKWIRLLDPATGFIAQSPRMAERLVTIQDRDGNYIVSPEDIAKAKADWAGACAKAREGYAKLRKSSSKKAKRGQDPLADILPILELSNPFLAFRMLCKGVRAAFRPDKRDFDGAEAARDVVVVGLLTQCAFRGSTMERLDLKHLVRDRKTGRWWMRVPRELFKNKDGPFFRVGQSDTFRPFYEKQLQDKHGLYEAIESYLGWARAEILKNKKGYKTDALLVTKPKLRRGVRRRANPLHPGRLDRDHLSRMIHELTARHVGYDEKRRKGIKGVKSFGTHRFRAILATAVMKRSRGRHPKAEAAHAIHDSLDTVERYVRFMPSDTAVSLDQTIHDGF